MEIFSIVLIVTLIIYQETYRNPTLLARIKLTSMKKKKEEKPDILEFFRSFQCFKIHISQHTTLLYRKLTTINLPVIHPPYHLIRFLH